MQTLFPDILIHDPGLGMICDEVADIAFVCVPTPLLSDGTLDTSIVEGVVKNAKEDLIVIRSTVNPGTCDRLIDETRVRTSGGKTPEFTMKNIVFQPEFLGETPNHPMNDQKARPWLILGGWRENTRKVIQLYQQTYNANVSIREMTLLEAEVVKLAANRAAAWKMMECQELFDVCEAANLDYYTIRDAVYGDDPRHNLWWTFIYENNRGFNSSKCLVKDIPAFATWAKTLGADADITKLLVDKSNQYAERNHSK